MSRIWAWLLARPEARTPVRRITALGAWLCWAAALLIATAWPGAVRIAVTASVCLLALAVAVTSVVAIVRRK